MNTSSNVKKKEEVYIICRHCDQIYNNGPNTKTIGDKPIDHNTLKQNEFGHIICPICDFVIIHK
jgi:hypothetical protein